MKRKALLIFTALVVCACAVSRVDPLSVTLNYAPDPKNLEAVGTLSCPAISAVQVSDARADKTLGIRTHESKPLRADVTTASDVAAWVQSGLQTLLSQNGFTVNGTGAKLLVSVDQLHASESIWHRSSYDARVALTARLQAANGSICWSEVAQGTGGAYGYAGSIPDYQQAINSALDAADLNLAQSAGFKDALCKCGGQAATITGIPPQSLKE